MTTPQTLDQYVETVRRLQADLRPAGIPAEVHYPAGEITIPAHVSHWAAERPDQVALALGDTRFTYAELDDAHRRVATWMSAHGVGRGDRVAIYLGNSTEFVIAFLAVLRLGAVHVPVNPMFQPAELAYELLDSEPVLVVTNQALSPTLEACADRVPAIPVLLTDGTGEFGWESAIAAEPYAGDDGDLDSLAALNYTGGTTGMPKGCQHSQRHMLYTVASAATATAMPADGSYVSLCYLPIFWIAGEDLGILIPFVLGGTSILMARWNAAEVVDTIERERVTLMTGTVENYLELMETQDLTTRDLSSLEDPQAVSFIRKMTPEVRRRWAELVPGSTLRESSYGMTETHTIDCVPYGFAENDFDLLSEPVFCGIPVPGTDIAVVELGTQTPVPLGEVGEIIVRSPSVTDGYWRNEEATRDQLVDGWIHTGDNGRIDEQGFLHYLGRRKEMIKVNGMSVFPADVEMLLAQHPAVDSVAVVPTDDPDTGQRPVAFVVPRADSDVTSEELVTWARGNMATYKVPLVKVLGSLPLTATGKVRKNELADDAAALNAKVSS
ncbi:AMP-binding protein [Aeromicrobium tamlense]|uniref:AMP-binding protein n=1 Tax=Aeromicrobium tamlense TaxID=375541 RepID=A0A8I0FV71_9ACTN|nr:AMP-binding protein [Aeromicrobium tamlense]MBD1269223.1 AMP-binding protein [Aeromicrobium tamlense]NYI36868.1 acyl-CoA synthetase (AMP-forming)/AMP-acid ligase II [Aeromicrobium tamlense]